MAESTWPMYVLEGKLTGGRRLSLKFTASDDEKAKQVATDFLEPHASQIEDELTLSRSDPVANIWNDPVDDRLFATQATNPNLKLAL